MDLGGTGMSVMEHSHRGKAYEAVHNEAIALLRGLDIPGYFNGASRGLLPPGDPHHFDRTR
ncbi:MAG TPA: hypothetical protein VFZ53_22830, partial [Polyangiaceae bacterium]